MAEERNKIFLQWLLPAGIMVVVIVIMLVNFSVKSQESMVTRYENELISTAKKYAQQVNHELVAMAKAGMPISNLIAQNPKMGETRIMELLDSLESHSDTFQVVYTNSAGKAITHSGEKVSLADKEEMLLLAEVESATKTTTYFYLDKDGIKGQSAIMSAIPINESADGYLLMYYPTNKFQEIMKNFELENNAFAVIVDGSGKILLKNSDKGAYLNSGNLYEALDQKSEDQIRKSHSGRVQSGLSGSLDAVAGGESRKLIYAPLGINNWALYIGVNQAYVEKQHQKLFKDTQNMLYQLIAVICIFLVVIVVINIINKMHGSEKTKQLQVKADTDLLTGLNNKLASERRIKEYIATHGNEIALMFVLDIDNFKTINDTMGHAFGDEVLRSLGDQISVYFRSSDVIGRTGGDEFTVFLKNLKDDVLIQKEANKILTFFRGFKAGEYVKYAATASIGAAVFPRDGRDFETLYKAADQALYKAKKRGKNQLAFYAEADDQKFNKAGEKAASS